MIVALTATDMACAQVQTFVRAGGWESFGGRAATGNKVCGISTQGGGRWLGIKYFEGESQVTIQLSKNTWRVRDGVVVDVEMQFDNEVPWTARATAFHMGDGDAALQFSIGSRQIDQWTQEFERSNTLFVRFPKEDEIEDWQADLSATQEMTRAWALCIFAMQATD